MSTGPTVGLIGFGRFGRAFADLLVGRGSTVWAWDPHVTPPPAMEAPTIADVADRSSIIVLATPVSGIATALDQLSPHVTPDHLVIDVASVKVGPAEQLQQALGDRIPWAATHPLFGPMNIARGDRSLKAIVCPNHLHPDGVLTARRLYESIGAEVIEQTPEHHDELMARTHAIAFFVAKGLIETGADDDLPFSPPSFQALSQTIETVRADAGHLFLAITRDNRAAAAARVELMNALSRTHDEIERASTDEPPSQWVSIDEQAGESPAELIETRDLIDELDRDLIRLLARRATLAGRAGSIKARRSRPVRDTTRETELLEERRRWAAELGLSEDAVAAVFRAVLGFSRDVQT